jgi:hypothetical protein
MPDFSSIGTYRDSHIEMENDFWNDSWFGGPVYDPVYKFEWEKNDDGSIKTDD